jgi:hypothetical protein
MATDTLLRHSMLLHTCLYQVWGILASVLHISSLEFTIEDTAEGDIVHLDPVVQQVCRHCALLYVHILLY